MVWNTATGSNGRSGPHRFAPTVLVADGREVVRRGLSEMLGDLPTFDCVPSSASSTEELMALTAELRPGVVIVGVNMPGLGDALPLLEPLTVILLVSRHQSTEIWYPLMSHTNGVILEDRLTVEQLSGVLESGCRGQLVLDNELTTAILDASVESDGSHVSLTPRELSVLDLMALGSSNKAIARELQISTHGAKRHVANVMLKLNCSNRTMAVAIAIAQGIVQADSQKILAASG